MGKDEIVDGWAVLAREHSYAVARGVRAVALVGSCVAEDFAMRVALERLEAVADVGATAFVLDRGDGFADTGYAGAAWAHDLYRWAVQQADDTVPQEQRHRIIGLLLGYSVEAVARFDEAALFPAPHAPSTSASAA